MCHVSHAYVGKGHVVGHMDLDRHVSHACVGKGHVVGHMDLDRHVSIVFATKLNYK